MRLIRGTLAIEYRSYRRTAKFGPPIFQKERFECPAVDLRPETPQVSPTSPSYARGGGGLVR